MSQNTHNKCAGCVVSDGTHVPMGQIIHPDDMAVDALAAAMKSKLAKQREKGYGGWDTDCTQVRLSDLLRSHVDKGDPVDVANFCAFLLARGEGIAKAHAITTTAARAGSVYVSGPMTGYPDWNFPAFHAASAALRAQGLKVINPADHGVVDGAEWADYLRTDLAQLAACERIHLLPGWSKSKGAQLELYVAKALGLQITLAEGAEALEGPAAPQAAVPLPLLVRDIARDLGITVPQACIALKPLGNYSTNTAVTAEMARMLREAFPNPAPQAVQAAVPEVLGWVHKTNNGKLGSKFYTYEPHCDHAVRDDGGEKIAVVAAPAHPADGVPAQVHSALTDARAVLLSINRGDSHRVKVGDDVCYWQRDEWVQWAINEVLPMVDAALAATHPTQQGLDAAKKTEAVEHGDLMRVCVIENDGTSLIVPAVDLQNHIAEIEDIEDAEPDDEVSFTLTFKSMPCADVDALPEFNGF